MTMNTNTNKTLAFLFGTQRFAVLPCGNSLVQLVKIPLTKHVEALYIQSIIPQKHTDEIHRRFPRLGQSLYSVGFIVNHKEIYSDAIELRSLLDDADSIIPLSVCSYMIEETVEQTLIQKLSKQKRPELSKEDMREAKKRAILAVQNSIWDGQTKTVLKSTTKQPIKPNFGPQLHLSYCFEDAIVDALSNTKGWSEHIVKRWLSNHHNKAAALRELAITEAAIKQIQ